MSAIVDKIKKLLRHGAKNSNPHEASAAIALAFELARKFAVDLDSIDLDDEEEIERLLIRIGARCSFERKLVLGIVQRFFRVHLVLCPPNVAFIGRSTDVMIAHYAHDFLLSALRAGLKGFQSGQKRKLSKTRRQGYVQGWIYGVANKLNDAETKLVIEDSKMAIVPVARDPRIQAASDTYYPNTKSVPMAKARKDKNAMGEGFADGNKVNVRTPISGPSPMAISDRTRPPGRQMDLFS